MCLMMAKFSCWSKYRHFALFFKKRCKLHTYSVLCVKNSSKMPILAAVDGARRTSLRQFLLLMGIFKAVFRVFNHLLLKLLLLKQNAPEMWKNYVLKSNN